MTNFKKRKTRKRYNKNNRKKRTRKLKGGNQEKKDIINNIKIIIKAQQVRHPLDFKRNHIWNHPDGQILKPKWLNILKTGSQIMPGIGGVYDNDEKFKSYREMTLTELKKTEKKIIKEISDYDEWTKKCKPFEKKYIVKGPNTNKLTCDKLAEQRKELGWDNFDCRTTNPQEDNPEPQPYQGLSTSPPHSGNQSNPQGGNNPVQIGETISPQTPRPTSRPTTPPTTPPTSGDEDDEDDEDDIPEQMRQYPERREGAIQLDGRRTKAIYDFVGEEVDDLSFTEGDEITVTEYKVGESLDWAKGYKITDPNKIGMFPRNHTTLKEEVVGQPNWYREVENGSVIFRKYNGTVLEREQKQVPQIWHSSGTRNLVNQPEVAQEQKPSQHNLLPQEGLNLKPDTSLQGGRKTKRKKRRKR
jgi:hypothetical protein